MGMRMIRMEGETADRRKAKEDAPLSREELFELCKRLSLDNLLWLRGSLVHFVEQNVPVHKQYFEQGMRVIYVGYSRRLPHGSEGIVIKNNKTRVLCDFGNNKGHWNVSKAHLVPKKI